jgi:hypothetical protein
LRIGQYLPSTSRKSTLSTDDLQESKDTTETLE